MNYLIIGLGNPGEKYVQTRHNVGWMVLDALAKENIWSKSSAGNFLSTTYMLGNTEVALIKPQTFMNRSGEAVQFAQKKYNTRPEHIIVVHDEIDVPFGTIKITQGRGAGGHNGVQSIIDHLHSNTFIRVRIGIAPKTLFGNTKKPQGREKVNRFVLGRFGLRERAILGDVIAQSVSAIRTLVEEGLDYTMNHYN